MKAETICPICKKMVVSDCRGCIEGGTLFHWHKGKDEPDIMNDIKWRITED